MVLSHAQVRLEIIVKVGRQLLHELALTAHVRQLPAQGAHVWELLVRKYPSALCVQTVDEPLVLHERQLGIAEAQGRQVELSRVRYRPAVLLQRQPEGRRMKGGTQATQVELVQSAQAIKV